MAKQKLEYLHPNVLLLITPKGVLIELFTPIKAKVVTDVGQLKVGTTVYIEAIVKSDDHRLLFLVTGSWIPYHHFRVG